jgi:hypothetical protein
MMWDMDAHQKQERRGSPRPGSPKKKGAGCAIFAIVMVVVAVVVVVAGAIMTFMFARKAHVAEFEDRMEYAETMLADSRAMMAGDRDESGLVMLSEESIGKIPATDFGDELSREHFIAVVTDEHATDLMRKQFAEKANGARVKWLLKVGDVSAPSSSGQIKASLSMPYRISRGNGWSGSSVSVRADFGPDAVDELMKVRRGQWVTLEGQLALEGNGRAARIVAARVVKRGAEMEE